MSDYINVALAAINLVRKKDLPKDDLHVPGVYTIQVAKGLKDTTMAAAALDRFHSEIPVDVLDNFSFIVFDPATGRVLEEDDEHEGYENTDLARDPQLASSRVPRLYSAKVDAVGDDGTVSELGTVHIVAVNKKEAGTQAVKCLWDARLDAASCTPCTCVKVMGLHG